MEKQPLKLSSSINFYKNHEQIGFIYNYLNRKIKLYHKDKLILIVEPNSKIKYNIKKFRNIFKNGNCIKIKVVCQNRTCDYITYSFDELPCDKTLKELNIGMITSRWVGGDSFQTIGSGLNAVQGLGYIRFHNFTDKGIYLNQNIYIPPHTILRYSGRDHFGVRLGTIFKDQENMYPDFILTVPNTDIYYGVVSDIPQPVFGGYQIDGNFDQNPSNPQFLLENGWMGGPAKGNIPFGYNYVENRCCLDKYLDRWGQEVTINEINNSPVGPTYTNSS